MVIDPSLFSIVMFEREFSGKKGGQKLVDHAVSIAMDPWIQGRRQRRSCKLLTLNHRHKVTRVSVGRINLLVLRNRDYESSGGEPGKRYISHGLLR